MPIASTSRVLLFADRDERATTTRRDTAARAERRPGQVRRYRLARLRLDDRPAVTGDRFAHLERTDE